MQLAIARGENHSQFSMVSKVAGKRMEASEFWDGTRIDSLASIRLPVVVT
jgi:hypothetical protein